MYLLVPNPSFGFRVAEGQNDPPILVTCMEWLLWRRICSFCRRALLRVLCLYSHQYS